jgi:hypothetical protein
MVLDAVMEFIDADEGDAQSMAAAVCHRGAAQSSRHPQHGR